MLVFLWPHLSLFVANSTDFAYLQVMFSQAMLSNLKNPAFYDVIVLKLSYIMLTP